MREFTVCFRFTRTPEVNALKEVTLKIYAPDVRQATDSGWTMLKYMFKHDFNSAETEVQSVSVF